jgi:hypothetical protein
MNTTDIPTRPELFPIPRKGFDPFFSQSRTAIYDLERRGLLRLVRITKPGKSRGRTFVNYAEIAAVMKRLAAQSTPRKAGAAR